MFTVPQLKPVTKLKLTACEGARVRRTVLATFSAGSHVETCLLCLTNLGDVVVLALPDLRRQVSSNGVLLSYYLCLFVITIYIIIFTDYCYLNKIEEI